MRRVIIESPYAGDIRKHTRYARRAMRDCLERGEAPIASHLLYTQPGVLKEALPHERALGIEAGLSWAEVADAAVFYADYGFSMGMLNALKKYGAAKVPVEVRYLFKHPRQMGSNRAPVKRSRAKRDRGDGSDSGTGVASPGVSDRPPPA
jgi:hypothetical protein